MNFILQPWQFLCMILAAWVHREQQELIEYLRCENQVLKEKLGKQRILLNDDQRRRWQSKGRSWVENASLRSGPCFRPTRSCAGIDCWWPGNGTMPTNDTLQWGGRR